MASADWYLLYVLTQETKWLHLKYTNTKLAKHGYTDHVHVNPCTVLQQKSREVRIQFVCNRFAQELMALKKEGKKPTQGTYIRCL